ncbi:MAG: hypothetical protein M3010_07085, partial [Candidatus Dormibacteraeota bacterium]|nr:hypothetical protein [Candidatus Dormibacteraeota bacterium]
MDGSSELDPAATEVVVRAVGDGVTLKSVTVQPDNAEPLTGSMQGGAYRLRTGLRTDSHYTVTAVTSSGAPGAGEVTETSAFSTATTPRVTAATPPTIGDGQSVVVALSQPAATISVDGPVKGQLSPDGTQVTVVPATYQQGQTYNFSVTARNRRGIAGSPQPLSFSSAPAATVDISPEPGTPNLGVAVPLTVTLSSDVADKADLVSRL